MSNGHSEYLSFHIGEMKKTIIFDFHSDKIISFYVSKLNYN